MSGDGFVLNALADRVIFQAVSSGLWDDGELFQYLCDDRFRSRIEEALSAFPPGSGEAARVDRFVDFLRRKLAVETSVEGLSDEWVVRSFGFSFVTASQREHLSGLTSVDELIGYAGTVAGFKLEGLR